MDLREQLQKTLGTAYALERELGGGGMSHVFLAEERALGRKVVVKVLPPTFSGAVNIERFKREVLVAAKLQHAHIVPLLTAGEVDGLPYFTMPFVEGESLCARIERDGALPIAETISILRDVARALAYAHDHGIVHRDIKPDNVMLSGGSAVVADFGIAKAISESRNADTNSTLTSVGTSLGTPAYISPEQAAADPATDHRADLYSLGCTAYEMLTGLPPFVEKTPQQLLAAHMAKEPEPVEIRRPDTPPALAALVMQCLQKDADVRPQSAGEIARALDAATTGAMQAATLLTGRGAAWRAVAVYVVAFIAVVVLAKAAIVGIGLPAWVLPGAIIVMALGLPAMLITAYVQRVTRRVHNSRATTAGAGGAHGTLATMAIKASPHVTWRRTMFGGAYALVGFVLLIGAFMLMREMGIGPAGSLLGAGKLNASDQILVADFKATGADTTLSGVVAEAMRSFLSQSRAVRVVPTSAIIAALDRMAKPSNTRITDSLAREIAMREGFKAYISGELTPVSGGYLVSARLIAANNGDVLASFQRPADGPSKLITTIDELGRELRGKIGESLRTVQSAPSLERVTTSSLDALRKYTEGARANDVDRDFSRAVGLLDEALKLDSNFAMAYRKLALALASRNAGDPRVNDVLQIAYRRTSQFAEAESLAVVAEFFRRSRSADRVKAIAAYEELVRRYPEWKIVVGNNLALTYASRREYARAESLYLFTIQERPEVTVPYVNIVSVQTALGKFDVALASTRAMRGVPALAPSADRAEARVLYNAGKIDSATKLFALPAAGGNSLAAATANFDLANLALREGRIRDWAKYLRAGRAINEARGIPLQPTGDSLFVMYINVFVRDDTVAANRLLESTAAKMKPADRISRDMAERYAMLGRPDRARALAVHLDSASDSVARRTQEPALHSTQGVIALGEKRYEDALKEFRQALHMPDGPASACPICDDHAFALVFDGAGMADSAIAVYTHYLNTPFIDRLNQDALKLGMTLRRLGELYDAKKDVPNAIAYYERFVDLWKYADAEVQPQVAQARERLRALKEIERRKGD